MALSRHRPEEDTNSVMPTNIHAEIIRIVNRISLPEIKRPLLEVGRILWSSSTRSEPYKSLRNLCEWIAISSNWEKGNGNRRRHELRGQIYGSIAVLEHYISSEKGEGAVIQDKKKQTKEALKYLCQIKENAVKIIDKIYCCELFQEAINTLRGNLSELDQRRFNNEPTQVTAKDTLISSLEKFQEELIIGVDNNNIPHSDALSIGYSVERLAKTLMERNPSADRMNKAIVDFQFTASKLNNARVALSVLGALICWAAALAASVLCPPIGLAAVIVLSLPFIPASLAVINQLDARRSPRLLFFTKPVVAKGEITEAVVNAATDMAKLR
jgi:hypothetical protein